jgi:type I restriction enzyme R subunit
VNEDDDDAQDYLPEDDNIYAMAADKPVVSKSSPHRETLDEYIAEYNQQYNTSFSTKDSQQFENYFKDISKRLKEREKETFNDEKDRLDLVLVVNMLLTALMRRKSIRSTSIKT